MLIVIIADTPDYGINVGLGFGFFTALVTLLAIATRLMVQAARNSDVRYRQELDRRDAELDRKDEEITALKEERDRYYTLWLQATGRPT